MDRRYRVVALGDSLTEGFGVSPGSDYPSVLQELLQCQGLACRVVNAGQCGDTCRGVATRLPGILASAPDLVIIEIGLNDVLMGAMVERIQASLANLLARTTSEGVSAALAGMVLPAMGDPDTERAFAAVYPKVAADAGVVLLPSFNEPALEVPGGVQWDGIHPTAAGYAAIAAGALPGVMQALKLKGPRAAPEA